MGTGEAQAAAGFARGLTKRMLLNEDRDQRDRSNRIEDEDRQRRLDKEDKATAAEEGMRAYMTGDPGPMTEWVRQYGGNPDFAVEQVEGGYNAVGVNDEGKPEAKTLSHEELGMHFIQAIDAIGALKARQDTKAESEKSYDLSAGASRFETKNGLTKRIAHNPNYKANRGLYLKEQDHQLKRDKEISKQLVSVWQGKFVDEYNYEIPESNEESFSYAKAAATQVDKKYPGKYGVNELTNMVAFIRDSYLSKGKAMMQAQESAKKMSDEIDVPGWDRWMPNAVKAEKDKRFNGETEEGWIKKEANRIYTENQNMIESRIGLSDNTTSANKQSSKKPGSGKKSGVVETKLPQPKNKADYSKLSKGARYMSPDGKIRIKN